MLYDTETELTEAVVRSFDATPDLRLREIMVACVAALHDAVRAVRPTAQEFQLALAFLREAGMHCTDKHNELVLLADVLGVSTLALLLQESGDSHATDSALLGPFYRNNSPETECGGSIVRSPTPGAPMRFTGLVSDAGGQPIENAIIDVWHAAPSGAYDIQDSGQADMNLRGRLRSDKSGMFCFQSVVPSGYPVPTHGPTGVLLRATRRVPFRPAHIHLLFYKAGFATLVTQHFVDTPEALSSDVVFGARRSLIGTMSEAVPTAIGPGSVSRPVEVESTFSLQHGTAHWPEAPIA
jgi:protocatechuate 3,4-dioxygenase beta subunit